MGLPGLAERRTHIIDYLSPQVKGKLLAPGNQLNQPPVGGIAGGKEGAVDKHAVTASEPVYRLIAQRGGNTDLAHGIF